MDWWLATIICEASLQPFTGCDIKQPQCRLIRAGLRRRAKRNVTGLQASRSHDRLFLKSHRSWSKPDSGLNCSSESTTPKRPLFDQKAITCQRGGCRDAELAEPDEAV
ncbi:hypothetical protein [Shinella curvata]|uniref:hypothetical protein n=1 Tax=Shinella curvata TaxID=1817964 RepID=UPI001FD4A6DC|nr:hypothetical protein [Shinella curvata]MCJ8056812.1 hypothetical protein [Shinella curvata]